MLDVRRLRLLRDLAHLGTIAAVAHAHTYTPSAVSRQLAALEREAGIPLLERTGHGITLTPAGGILVEHIEVILAAVEQANAALAAAAGDGICGRLRIGAFPTAVRTLLPPTLVKLGREHPRLELTVSELPTAAIPDALRKHRLDVGLTHDYTDALVVDTALDMVPLLDETVFLALPAAHRPIDGNPLRAARDASWIVVSPEAVSLRVCQAAGFTPHIRHQADDFATVLALVAAGQGVCLIPQLAAQHAPDGVDLIPLTIRRRTKITYRRGAATHPAITAFVATIRSVTATVQS